MGTRKPAIPRAQAVSRQAMLRLAADAAPAPARAWAGIAGPLASTNRPPDLNDAPYVGGDGWVTAGSWADVCHSTGEGATWVEEAAGLTGRMLTATFAVGSHTVYAVGYSGTVLKYSEVAPDPAPYRAYLPLSLGRMRP